MTKNNQSPVKNILLDLDGTVCESAPGIKASFMYALDKYGIKINDPAELDKTIGPPLYESFTEFFGMDDEDAHKAVAYYREHYSVTGMYMSTLYPHIKEMLETLKRESDKKIYLATSKPIEYAELILKNCGVDMYFDGICGNNLKDERHTKEQVIEYIFNTYDGVTPENSIMVGDRKFDIDGAKFFKMRSIGVLFGYAPAGELEAHGADFIVSDAKELTRLLLEL